MCLIAILTVYGVSALFPVCLHDTMGAWTACCLEPGVE